MGPAGALFMESHVMAGPWWHLPPDLAPSRQVWKIIKEIDEAEQVVSSLKQKLKEAVEAASSSNQHTREYLARDLYWKTNVAKVPWILKLLGLQSMNKQFRKIVGLSVVLATCCDCEKPITATSKTNAAEILSKLKKDGEYRCLDCWEHKWERNQEQKEQPKQHEEQVGELRSMDYSEYLKTQHWQELRKKALKRARYRCSLCNEKNQILDVHHRSYEHRGQFWDELSDLIVLCRPCHDHHHEEISA